MSQQHSQERQLLNLLTIFAALLAIVGLLYILLSVNRRSEDLYQRLSAPGVERRDLPANNKEDEYRKLMDKTKADYEAFMKQSKSQIEGQR